MAREKILDVPCFKQKYGASCVPTAIAMLRAYFEKKPVSEKEVSKGFKEIVPYFKMADLIKRYGVWSGYGAFYLLKKGYSLEWAFRSEIYSFSNIEYNFHDKRNLTTTSINDIKEYCGEIKPLELFYKDCEKTSTFLKGIIAKDKKHSKIYRDWLNSINEVSKINGVGVGIKKLEKLYIKICIITDKVKERIQEFKKINPEDVVAHLNTLQYTIKDLICLIKQIELFEKSKTYTIGDKELNVEKIINFIDCGYPILIGGAMIGGPGHEMLIVGYKQESNDFTIYANDPLDGDQKAFGKYGISMIECAFAFSPPK